MADTSARRLAAARGIVGDFDRQLDAANRGDRSGIDWLMWAGRLAATCRTVIGLADEAIVERDNKASLNREMAELFEEILAGRTPEIADAPQPAVASEPEPLIDPDCRDPFKHASCVGGPCECNCHKSAISDCCGADLGTKSPWRGPDAPDAWFCRACGKTCARVFADEPTEAKTDG
jgi:hypothetical protein